MDSGTSRVCTRYGSPCSAASFTRARKVSRLLMAAFLPPPIAKTLRGRRGEVAALGPAGELAGKALEPGIAALEAADGARRQPGRESIEPGHPQRAGPE